MEIDAPTLVAAAAVVITILILTLKGGKKEQRYPVILGMATGNPKYQVTQTEALEVAKQCPDLERVRPILDRIYPNSKIESRFFAVPDFCPDRAEDGDELFFPTDHRFRMPVEVRLNKYKEVAVPLCQRVCQDAIDKSGVPLKDIGKIVVVSSTGFLGPGLDCELIVRLGLGRDTDRSLVGFMGCAAAMNGFRIAMDYVKTHPGKKALLCCVEISSVHTTFDDNVNDSILHAIFADGCASAVLGNETKATSPEGTLAIVDDFSWLCEGTEDGITLAINENGISCTLSKYLPQYIAKHLGAYVRMFLARHPGMTPKDCDFWAVHPGGRRIIEEAQNGVGLTDEQCSYSWAVLAKYGNMLSPSVMFVLELIFAEHHRQRASGKPGMKQGLAFSFSPGVGAEGIMLRAF